LPSNLRPTTRGATENAGRKNDGPSKSRGMKKQDMLETDQVAGHKNDRPSKSRGVKNARHQNAGHEIAGHENAGLKMLDTKTEWH